MNELVRGSFQSESWTAEQVHDLAIEIGALSADTPDAAVTLRRIADRVSELGYSGGHGLIDLLEGKLTDASPDSAIVRFSISKLECARALRNGDLQAAEKANAQARQIALARGWEREVSACSAMSGSVLLRRGDYRGARASYEDAVVAARRAADPTGEATAMVNLALALKNLGQLGEAERLIGEARQVFERGSDSTRMAQCDQNLSSVLFKLGRWTEAEAKSAEAEAVFSAAGMTANATSSRIARARALRALGRIEDARSLLTTALSQSRREQLHRSTIVALEFLGDCALDERGYAEAADLFGQALLQARQLGNATDLVVECARGLARTLVELGDLESSLSLINESIETATAQGDKFELANSLLVRASVHAASSGLAQAEQDLTRAASIASDCGDRYCQATAVLLLSRLHEGQDSELDWTAARALGIGILSLLGAQSRELSPDVSPSPTESPAEGGRHQPVAESAAPQVPGFLTTDPRVRKTLGTVQALAPQTLNILILGESGTGKELIAKAVHDQSGRKGPFVPVNCSAFPGDLIEGELFGHARGAYTGADRERLGLFEYANKGTLFLDEIGDMPIKAQARLLRVLETGEVRRLGENNSRVVDVRIVAATHRHLLEMVGAGEFRLDLYYRLAGFVVDLPPVRERPDDARLLVDHYFQRFAKEQDKSLTMTPELRQELATHSWPGNVREIRLMMQRLVALTPSGTIVRRLPFALEGDPRPRTLPEVLEAEEKKRILDALQSHNWNKARAAITLGTSRTTLIGKMKRMGITLSKK